jgi:hypothetical protein
MPWYFAAISITAAVVTVFSIVLLTRGAESSDPPDDGAPRADNPRAVARALWDVQQPSPGFWLVGDPKEIYGAVMTFQDARKATTFPISPGTEEFARAQDSVYFYVFIGDTLEHRKAVPAGSPPVTSPIMRRDQVVTAIIHTATNRISFKTLLMPPDYVDMTGLSRIEVDLDGVEPLPVSTEKIFITPAPMATSLSDG